MARGLLNVALAAVAIALALAAPGEGAARLRLAAASGSLSLSNSKAGQAVFSAAAMRPGQEAGGSVTIGNTGTVPAALNVASAAIQDTPGVGGGRLSETLQLRVLDVTNPQIPATVYSGPLRAMGAVGLGSLAPGANRTFVFVATMTPSAGDNAFQGAAISMGFEWTAVGTEVVATPTPTPTATPAPPSPVTPAPPVVTTPAGPLGPDLTGEALGARIFRLPPATRCLSKRNFMIRVRLPKGMRFKKLTIRVNGHVKLKRKGLKARKVKARINLRGMPKGKVMVKIVATTNTGRTAVRKRTYHTCAKRR
jgi:hypothetical protein